MRGLLAETVLATLRELEELREQGEVELGSIMGGEQARMARFRYSHGTCAAVRPLLRISFFFVFCMVRFRRRVATGAEPIFFFLAPALRSS